MINLEVSSSITSDAYCVFINSSLEILSNVGFPNRNQVDKFLKSENWFDGKFGSVKTLTIPENELLRTIILVGVGEEDKLNVSKLESLGGKVQKIFEGLSLIKASVLLFDENTAYSLICGSLLSSYKFHKYLTKDEDKKYFLKSIEFVAKDLGKISEIIEEQKLIASCVMLARDCVNEPPNKLNPVTFADLIKNELDPLGVKVDVFDKKEIEKLKMGALLGVSQGSHTEPRVVVMHYEGIKGGDVISFAGKGVTFDSGGISIKPSNGMEEMKYDMSGSAAIFCAIKLLASRKAKVNVVGIVGLVENMPGGGAQRPSDITHSYSGQTIEVLNTDAEGRLVLADLLSYVQEKFAPKTIIDVATLTGAIRVALGQVYAGVFANDDELAKQIVSSGMMSNEKVWHMPMDEEYDSMIKSKIADVANISTSGSGGGACTAAHFLKRFVRSDVSWAHIDIASVASDRRINGEVQKGGVGFGVRLLNEIVQKYYETK